MIRKLLGTVVGIAMLATVGIIALFWFSFRIYVAPNECAVLIRKTGTALTANQKVATEPGQKGIQREVLGPGRYFKNPYTWSIERHPLVEISSGDPKTWEWVHSLDAQQREAVRTSTFKFKGKFPEVGVLVRRTGDPSPDGSPVVSRASNYSGIIKEVLTPGTYKLNPYVYDVERYPAAVIPAGFVGVVTNMFANTDEMDAGTGITSANVTSDGFRTNLRQLSKRGQRGTVEEVLQPGVYLINPKLKKVTLIEIGFNEYSQIRVSDMENNRISFPSDTGYDIRVGVTIIWGIDPKNAATIINEFGNVDRVLETVIGSQLPSICRNIGSTYDARDFIHGEKREMFQRDLTEKLQEVCQAKKVEVLLALVREIEVHAPNVGSEGEQVTEDLKRTIQQSYIAIEKRLTKEKQRDAAVVRAELEEAQKKVDIARETIQADTRVMVANILADAEKQAAEIDAQAELEVATIQQEIALLDAQRTEILGQARADVEKFKNQAEADGYRMLVDAFGGGRAFNLYTFANEFKPDSIRLFFAGEGTFWTDLKGFEEVGAARLLGNQVGPLGSGGSSQK
ncbi:MAG TPA: SPFH domain-containing protein [Phycisphaerae bacterium]|nr:SPFH domain-containing protein [Phycisphaerae bacterium]